MIYDHQGLPVKRLLIMIIELSNLRAQMLTTGNQLKAARMLADVEQIELAEISGVSVSTIRAMEGQGGATLRNGMATVRRVQDALETRGIEFQNHGKPGVRLVGSSKGESA
jgi:DNA-binding XRE family transcriptional regulator